MKKGLYNYTMYNIMVASLIALCFFEKESILIREYPKLIILGYGSVFSLLACRIQLSTIGKGEFIQFNRGTMISFSILMISLFLGSYIANIILDIGIVLFIIINCTTWIMFGYKLSNELADLLNINIFSLGKRKEI